MATKNELLHYGVKGMKWRKRKARSVNLENSGGGGGGSGEQEENPIFSQLSTTHEYTGTLSTRSGKRLPTKNGVVAKYGMMSMKDIKNSSGKKLTNVLTNAGHLGVRRKKVPKKNGTLVHFGVKGQKWGVLNEESKRRKGLLGRINDIGWKAANVASLGAIGHISRSERKFKDSYTKIPSTPAGYKSRTAKRVGGDLANRFLTSFGTSFASAMIMNAAKASGSPSAIAGAEMAGKTLKRLGNVRTGLITGYNVYSQLRDTKNYMFYR